MRWKLPVAPAVFGMTDGLTCALGVILSLTKHTDLILPTAVSVGSAECVGMAAGEWLSESDEGFTESVVIGVASGLAAVAPAVPYTFLASPWATWASLLVFALVAGVVTAARRPERGLGRALLETYGILLAVAAAVWISQLFTPHGG